MADMTDSAEHITRAEIIAGHLHRLQKNHALLSVNIPGNKQFYNSMLINIDDGNQNMLLDVLHPASGHEALMKHKALIISSSHDGVELGFKSEVESIVTDDGKPAYLIPFPEKLVYKQRRASFRAPVGLDNLIPVDVGQDENEICSGHIINISSGGILLQFDNSVAIKFEKGMILPSCRFNTDKETVLQTEGKICNVYIDKVHRLSKVGIKFIDLTNAQERQIQKLVKQLERAMIQRSNQR